MRTIEQILNSKNPLSRSSAIAEGTMQGALPGFIFSIDDPLKQGRVQIVCPLLSPDQVLPHGEDNWIPVAERFICNGKAGGSLSPLEKGIQVFLEPQFGSTQQSPSWLVVGCVYSTVDQLHPLLDRSKGTWGSVTSGGRVEVHNDKEDSHLISHPNGAILQISKEGNITNQTKGNARSHLGKDGEVRIENEKSFHTHDPSGQVSSGNAGGASSVLSASGNVNVASATGSSLSLQSSADMAGSGGSSQQALSKLEGASQKISAALKELEKDTSNSTGDTSNSLGDTTSSMSDTSNSLRDITKLSGSSTKISANSEKLSDSRSEPSNSSQSFTEKVQPILQSVSESLKTLQSAEPESLGVSNFQEISNFLRYQLDVLKPAIHAFLDTDRSSPEYLSLLTALFLSQNLPLDLVAIASISRTTYNLRYSKKQQINYLLSKLLGSDYAPETGILESLELEPVLQAIAKITPEQPDAIALLQSLLPPKLKEISTDVLIKAIALPPVERIGCLIGTIRKKEAQAIQAEVSKLLPKNSKQSSNDSSNVSNDASNSSKQSSNVSNNSSNNGSNISNDASNLSNNDANSSNNTSNDSNQSLEELVTQATKDAQQKIQSFLGSIPSGSGAAKVTAGSSSAELLAAGGASKVSATPSTAFLQSPAGKVEAGKGGSSMSGGGGSLGVSGDSLGMQGKGGEKVEISPGKISMAGNGEGAIAIDKDDVVIHGQGGAVISLAGGKIEAMADEILLKDVEAGTIRIAKSEIAIQGKGDRILVNEVIEIGQGGSDIKIEGLEVKIGAKELNIGSEKVAIASPDLKIETGTGVKVYADSNSIKFSYLDNELKLAPDLFSSTNKAGASTLEALSVVFTGGKDTPHKLEILEAGILADGVNIVGSIQSAATRLDATEAQVETLENKTDWGKLEAQGISQFFLEAQGDTRTPATRTVSIRNLFAATSPYPDRLGAIAASPNGSNAIGNSQRLVFTNAKYTERRAVSNQLAVLSGGFVRFTYTVAAGSPTDTAFNPTFSLYKIFLTDGSEVSATGVFTLLNGVLTWTANTGSPVVNGTRGWTLLAIDYPVASGISPGFSSFDNAWITNVAIAPANLRPLSQDLQAYENPADGQAYIVIYNRAAGAIDKIYKKITLVSDVNGRIRLPVGANGCFAFVEGLGVPVLNIPVVGGLGANQSYNCLYFHAPASAEFWQFQIAERNYQGTQDLSFLEDAIVATMPRLYAHTQGGGLTIPSTWASLTDGAIANYLSELSVPEDEDPTYARYFFNGPIRETGESTATPATTFKQLQLLPSTNLAFPVLGEAIAAVVHEDITHARSISAELTNADGRTFGFHAPLVTAAHFQYVLTFVALKAGVAKLVIATQTRESADPDKAPNLVLDSELGMAIDTFPLQPLPAG